MILKKTYVSGIYTRKLRLEKYRKLYGDDPEFKKREEQLLHKIAFGEKRVREIGLQEKMARKLGRNVAEFLLLKVRGGYKVKLSRIGKRLFYRWGAENGIQLRHLQIYAGAIPTSPAAAQMRMRFIKDCQNDPIQRDLWERFKIFMKESSNQLG